VAVSGARFGRRATPCRVPREQPASLGNRTEGPKAERNRGPLCLPEKGQELTRLPRLVGPVALSLRELARDLREVLQPGRALADVALEPAHRRLLVLRRSALGVQVDELERVLEREVRQLAGGVLCQPQRAALDRPAEADLGVRLRGHERMFSLLDCQYERAEGAARGEAHARSRYWGGGRTRPASCRQPNGARQKRADRLCDVQVRHRRCLARRRSRTHTPRRNGPTK